MATPLTPPLNSWWGIKKVLMAMPEIRLPMATME
jgi:hypothetical protein